MEIKSTEFFRNMKTLPPPGIEEFRQLIKWEEEKILGGVNINGVHISGWLYWHLNHWWIRIDDVSLHDALEKTKISVEKEVKKLRSTVQWLLGLGIPIMIVLVGGSGAAGNHARVCPKGVRRHLCRP